MPSLQDCLARTTKLRAARAAKQDANPGYQLLALLAAKAAESNT